MNFTKADELYVKEYGNKSKYVHLGEHKIALPKMPSEKDILNYNLKSKDQKFIRTIVPRDIRTWSKADERYFVEAEWHKRFHGVWMFIKGKPFYIPGSMYTFMNYWFTEAGMLPIFRMEALEFFLFWEFVRDNPDCLGYFIIKCRRLGDTEKALFVQWDETTRWRYVKSMMQNYNGDQAKKNFHRLAKSNHKMIYFFKPKHKGHDIPERILDFSYPSEVLTKSKHKKKQDSKMFLSGTQERGLESSIEWHPTTTRAGDGSRHVNCYLDEVGKVKVSEMKVEEQVDILSKTITLNNDMDVIGKFQLTTTVEEVDSGKTVEVCRRIWKNADTSELTENGRTKNGLFRLFRGYQLAARVDEWGFHNREEAKRFRDAQIKALTDSGQIDRVIALKRKQPASIKESLVTPETDCILNPHTLDIIIDRLRNKVNAIGENIEMPRRGNLQWASHRFGPVRFVDNPEGHWEISQHPTLPNNKSQTEGGFTPNNGNVYSCGIDPIDSTQGSGSDLAIVVHRRLNWNAEQGIKFDTAGNPLNDYDMVTNQIVCTYRNRPMNEADIVDHVLLTLFYYGVPGFIELQKGRYLMNTMTQMGMFEFIQQRPMETFNNPVARRATAEVGAAASTSLIHLYVNALKNNISRYMNLQKHLSVMEDAREFNMDNRSDRDITVAWGFALLGAMDSSQQEEIKEMETELIELW